jgi:ligand-binding SRPBCC domain-containing protein
MTPRIFQSEVWLPRPIDELFAFFANAANLEALTPRWIGFSILTPQPIELRRGAIIDYRLRLHGIPVRWRTEITAWEPPNRFVDEQRRGPYRLWVHEHRFTTKDGGTNISDVVRYAPPGGWIVDWLFVRRDVERIFDFRREKLQELFS